MLNYIKQDELKDAFYQEFLLNASIFGAGVVIVVILGCRYLKLEASKLLSFRLSMWISIFDLIYYILFYAKTSNNTLCTLVSITGFFCKLSSEFVIVQLMYNLQSVLVKKRKRAKLTEAFCLSLSVFMSAIVIMPYSIFSLRQDSCNLLNSFKKPYKVILFLATYNLWIILSIGFCIYSSVEVILNLFNYKAISDSKENETKNNELFGGTQTLTRTIEDKTNQKVVRAVRRILLYPIVNVFTQLPFIVYGTLYMCEITKGYDFESSILYYVPQFSSGILNGIAFLVDPASHDAWVQLKDLLIKKRRNFKGGIVDRPADSKNAVVTVHRAFDSADKPLQ